MLDGQPKQESYQQINDRPCAASSSATAAAATAIRPASADAPGSDGGLNLINRMANVLASPEAFAMAITPNESPPGKPGCPISIVSAWKLPPMSPIKSRISQFLAPVNFKLQ